MELRTARRIAQLTQRQLAKKARVDYTIISRLESGDRACASYPTMVRIARALNVTAEEIFPVPDLPDPDETEERKAVAS